MNKTMLFLCFIISMPAHADLCINKWSNKWQHGDDYKFLNKTKQPLIFGLAWEKAIFNPTRNRSKDRSSDNILVYYAANQNALRELSDALPNYETYLQEGYLPEHNEPRPASSTHYASALANTNTIYKPFPLYQKFFAEQEQKALDELLAAPNNRFNHLPPVLVQKSGESDDDFAQRKQNDLRNYLSHLFNDIRCHRKARHILNKPTINRDEAEQLATLLNHGFINTLMQNDAVKQSIHRGDNAALQHVRGTIKEALTAHTSGQAQAISQHQSSTTQPIIPEINHVRVSRQTDNTCGFHALKNAFYLLNAEEDGPTAEENSNQFPLSAWQKLAGRNIDLDRADIQKVAEEHLRMNQATYAVIPSLKEFKRMFAGSDEEFDAVCETIQALREKRATKFAFIIGNMEHAGSADTAMRGTYGHWVTILVDADAQGKITLKCADSKYRHVDSGLINTFKDFLNQDPYELKILRKFSNKLPDGYTNPQIPLERRLGLLKELMEEAAQEKLNTADYFMIYIKQIMTNMEQILKHDADFTPMLDEDRHTIKEISSMIAQIQRPDNEMHCLANYPHLNQLLSQYVDANDKENELNQFITRTQT